MDTALLSPWLAAFRVRMPYLLLELYSARPSVGPFVTFRERRRVPAASSVREARSRVRGSTRSRKPVRKGLSRGTKESIQSTMNTYQGLKSIDPTVAGSKREKGCLWASPSLTGGGPSHRPFGFLNEERVRRDSFACPRATCPPYG